MSDIETIKNNVWDAMEGNRKPFNGEHFSLFTRGFERFSDQVATLAALRIGNALEAFIADELDTADLGTLIRPARRTIMGQPNTMVLELLTALDTNGEPRFMVQASKDTVQDRPRRRTPIEEQVVGTHEVLNVSVFETRPSASGRLRDFQDRLLHADVSFFDRWTLGSGTMPCGDYHRLAAFSAALFEALPHKSDQLSGKILEKDINPLNADIKALLDFDGGLPGPETAAVVDDYNAFTAYEIAKWAIPALREVASAQQGHGFVWGGKYLNYNDLDDSCFAIPTGVDGRSAVFHDNISLINDYRSYIAWVDPSGESSELSVRMIDSSENAYDLVERFIAGEDIDRTMTVVLEPAEVLFAKHYRDTDILSTLAFHIKVDHELFVDGELAERDDAHEETDFSAFIPEADEADDEEEVGIAKP